MDRAADDFDVILARMQELRQQPADPTCGSPDEEAGVYYLGETGWYNCAYEQSWAVRRNRM